MNSIVVIKVFAFFLLILIHVDCRERGGEDQEDVLDYFADYESKMANEEAARALLDKVLDSDLLGGFDSPKEISIHCPSEPQVKIKDIVLETNEQGVQACSIISMTGPNFKFRFEVNCQDEE
jgi:hypothetical protein